MWTSPLRRLQDGGVNIIQNAMSPPTQLNVVVTWSLNAAYQHGVIMGKEAKLFNIAVGLPPRVNILRDPVEGNFWQSYSEDPYLNARLDVQGVTGLQDQGSLANAKQIGPPSTGASVGNTNNAVDFQTLASETALTFDDGLNELMEKAAAANLSTVVVLNNAEPVLIPWLDDVSAVLEMMCPNQEGGWAADDLLLGNNNPQGRLPVTYPASLDSTMTHNPCYPERVAMSSGNATFSEGLNNSYCWYVHTNTSVLFPIGYGLSYTSFYYSNPNFHTSTLAQQSDIDFKCASVEVPQVYIGPPSNAVTTYPNAQLAATALVEFANVELGAGDSTTASIDIREKQLSFYNVNTTDWELAKATHSKPSIPVAFIMRPLPISLAAVTLLLVLVSATDPPTVTVKNGSYYGAYQSNYNQDFFLGMPYAQPPVGDLRFRNPEPLNSTWSEAKNATEYSPECYGYGSDQWVLGNVISEDCLTINVVRPSGIAEGVKLPVGFWIHGGGLFEGGNRDPRYNFSAIIDEATAAGKPFIGVSINYRLHGFGFLWGSDVEEAGVTNLGFRDQRLALHWVQENIAAFGGDPEKVTIWGESAGGWSVGYQLLAYGGRDDGLFRGAIMQSGAPAHGPSSYTNASTWDVYYNNIIEAANCSSATSTLDCLRQVPIDDLSAIFNSSVTSSASFSPVIDGDFIQDTGANLLKNEQFVHVPILHGQNHDEGTAFGTWGVNSSDAYLDYLELMGNTVEEAAILADVYPDIPEIGIPGTLHGRPTSDSLAGSQFKRVCAYAGDAYMHAPRRYTAESWAAHNVTSYSYVFNVLVNGLTQYIGATHFQEVAFVFYNLDGNGYENAVSVNPFLNEPKTFLQLARMMTRMWASFIVDQTPNNNGVSALEWPEYTSDSPQNIVFDVNVTELAYIELDIYRAEAITYLHSRYFD
ncbi:hypothetical protein BBO99_00005861 [Phytophthora kernoviae]|uniref:Fibronectin type III-like domain-containing protein n=1 Tax=Phytophthora kernoviae TaxID=325452 RepID=A0A3R7KIH8_9STRA|nr:hypothetical protein JM16_006108 [Phytophthora kernoviae]RLN78594.1 hypothetical protein BBO99_00005861 [Phytophthora kernoviae]